MLEPLEDRRLYARVVVSLLDRTLTIRGTAAADDIATVAAGKRRFTLAINGDTAVYRNDTVSTVRVFAGAGNDTVDLGDLLVRASVEGGRGDDNLIGGYGDDTIAGNAGDDYLAGGDGVDYLDGGRGDDHLENGEAMYGGAGNDVGLTSKRDIFAGGLESLYNPDQPAEQVTPRGTLYSKSGRLLLDWIIRSPGGGDSDDLTGPHRRIGTAQEMWYTSYSGVGGGALYTEYLQTYDITDAQANGLIFTYRHDRYLEGTRPVDRVILLPM